MASRMQRMKRCIRPGPSVHGNAMSLNPARCFLARHAYVTAADGVAIILDLRSGRYLGFGGTPAAMLGKLMCMEAHEPVNTAIQDHAFVAELLERGILTTDPALAKPRSIEQLPRAEKRLYAWDGAHPFEFKLRQALQFLGACVWARIALRVQPLERIVDRIEHRKAAHGSGASPELHAVRDLARIFRALRPLVYSAERHCLLDSLVLVEFLAQNGVYPSWVIGVKPAPFAAHSWVQMGRYVLNGAPGYVRAYSPILVV